MACKGLIKTIEMVFLQAAKELKNELKNSVTLDLFGCYK
ncbi:MAG: hypothetical protein ACJAYN_000320 [Bermanella sp.]|jgi:hypothetical protein